MLLVVAGLYLAASGTVHTFYGVDFMEEQLNRSLPSAMKGHYRVEVEAVRWSLWRRSLLIGSVALHPTGRGASVADSSGFRYTASVAHVQFRGLRVWPLLWKGAVHLDNVTVQRPVLRRTDGSNGHTKGKRLNDVRRTIRTAVVQRLPPIRIRRLQIQDGKIALLTERRESASPIVTDSLWGLSLRAHGVSTDSADDQEKPRLLFSDSLRGSVDGYHHLSLDSLYTMSVGAVSVSTADSSLSVEGMQIEPTVSDLAFMRRQGHRANRVFVSLQTGEVRGLDVRRFLENQSVRARTVVLDSLHVDVYRDNHFRPPPIDPSPKMPHELGRDLRRTVHIDTIRVREGYARYSKWKAGAATPGHISFEEIDATIGNVTNDPDHMSSSTPAVIEADTRVAGAGRLHVTIRISLLAPHLSLTYDGRLGPTDVRAFNDASVPLSGIRIEKGHVDSLWFSANVDQGRARGTVHGVYRDLEVEMLDKQTGKRGLGKRLRTVVLDDLLLKSDNTRSNTPFRRGRIKHELAKDDTFFKFLWHSVRSGLMSLVGL